MRQGTIAMLLAAALSAAGAAALAQDATPKEPLAETEQAIVDALTRTMDLLSRTFDKVMIYEVPELLPNGDIIIRRKQPRPEPREAIPPGPDSGKVAL